MSPEAGSQAGKTWVFLVSCCAGNVFCRFAAHVPPCALPLERIHKFHGNITFCSFMLQIAAVQPARCCCCLLSLTSRALPLFLFLLRKTQKLFILHGLSWRRLFNTLERWNTISLYVHHATQAQPTHSQTAFAFLSRSCLSLSFFSSASSH